MTEMDLTGPTLVYRWAGPNYRRPRVVSIWRATVFCDPLREADSDEPPTREIVVAGRLYRRLDAGVR